ncbi:unnamed protein product [Vitrella brassicaformis CCMP3155]|uniref:Fe2OG dioxygenase domain-containing protein n=1 Tax=Vitrella brassicaformis (strain CCMP3155) TaxID=1169540 RepID=A0A0G4FQ76_VITBC|nr:unnamed protein product [Vitrella brassicaformis CCMP3155]|eukprot:CEM16584.1 unnamed protein product [Vitrella brassicaformis CCMP3155]
MQKNVNEAVFFSLLQYLDTRPIRKLKPQDLECVFDDILNDDSKLEALLGYPDGEREQASGSFPRATLPIICGSHFVGDDVCGEARKEAEGLHEGGHFKSAGMGRPSERREDSGARGDELMWLNEASLDLFDLRGLKQIAHKIESVRRRLNSVHMRRRPANVPERASADNRPLDEEDGGPFSKSEIQLTRYPGGGSRYVRHLDASQSNNRLLTLIVYLNPDWQTKHGGELRALTESEQVDIPPLMDTFVLFRSDMIEHEVLPCYCERYAVSCWFHVHTDCISSGKDDVA